MRQADMLDSVILFLCCAVFSIMRFSGELSVVPLIIATIVMGLMYYYESRNIRLILGVLYTLLCFFYPAPVFFLPVILYGCFDMSLKHLMPLGLLPLLVVTEITGSDRLVIALIAVLSILIRLRTIFYNQLRDKHLRLRDTMREMSLHLHEQNRNLMEKQDDAIHLATLKERNRIAREIHDNVGHLLSSALLQIGALLTITKESTALGSIKDTLNKAMDNIRNSVHQLHDTSVDLRAEIETLVEDFTFCDIDLNIHFENNPEAAVKYAVLTIIKEAFANIINHSDATRVNLSFIEHPGFYQLIVSDNGKVKNYHPDNGIGLKNITQRVEALKGQCRIRTDNGFGLFMTIPREAKHESVNR